MNRGYIVKEMLIGVAPNMIVSAAFVFLIFGGQTRIPLWGPAGVAFDFIPQIFVISFMSVLIPSLLTRSRVKAGRVSAGPSRSPLISKRLVVRAGVLAAAMLVVLGGLSVVSLSLFLPGPYAFTTVMAVKLLVALAAGWMITPVAVQAALSD